MPCRMMIIVAIGGRSCLGRCILFYKGKKGKLYSPVPARCGLARGITILAGSKSNTIPEPVKHRIRRRM
uniref:Putative secreted peptide n=1 Tax=Anopheles braziliensis TaxID=58242 RepID=A0A2M3ZVA4_9DIPT